MLIKFSDLASKTVDELNDLLNDKRKKLYNLRFQKVNNALKDTSLIRKVRCDIARLTTKLFEVKKVAYNIKNKDKN